MRQIFGCIAMLALLGLAWGGEPAKSARKTSPAKKSAAAHKAPARKSTAGGKATTARKGSASRTSRSTTASRRTARKGPVRRTASWRTRQMAPTPERYREIQEALVAKGYLQPADATGVWGPSSVDALKRFQAEQKIESNGKINSLSLIALGLGPKRETAVKPSTQVPPAAVDPGRV